MIIFKLICILAVILIGLIYTALIAVGVFKLIEAGATLIDSLTGLDWGKLQAVKNLTYTALALIILTSGSLALFTIISMIDLVIRISNL